MFGNCDCAAERPGHADKAYDSADLRAAFRQRGIVPRIAQRGIERI